MGTTEENNRLIAIFMGMNQGIPTDTRWKNDWFEELKPDGNDFQSGRRHEYLLFHTSWDWLIPVVEKIESLGYTVNISRITTSISEMVNEETMFSWVCGDISKKLEITYNTVVQFIEWYNEQTKS